MYVCIRVRLLLQKYENISVRFFIAYNITVLANLKTKTTINVSVLVTYDGNTKLI